MGETDLHRQLMVDLIEALRQFYASDPTVYVTGNLLLLYEELNPNAHLSPDVMVVPGTSKEPRENFRLWEEPAVPALIVEVTSKSTRMRDTGIKKGLYEAMGVREYLLFDPLGDYLKPRFKVFRLGENGYVPVLVPAGRFTSELGLEFRVVGESLRVYHEDRLVLNPAEQAERADREAERANCEASRADAEKRRADELERRLRELEESP